MSAASLKNDVDLLSCILVVKFAKDSDFFILQTAARHPALPKATVTATWMTLCSNQSMSHHSGGPP